MSALENRIVVLTGASEGIGRALALRLANGGARLVLAARNQARLESLAEQCRDSGAQAIAVPTDVTDPAQCEALVQAAVDSFGGIDILIANAGATMWSRFDELEDLTVVEQVMAGELLRCRLLHQIRPALAQTQPGADRRGGERSRDDRCTDAERLQRQQTRHGRIL